MLPIRSLITPADGLSETCLLLPTLNWRNALFTSNVAVTHADPVTPVSRFAPVLSGTSTAALLYVTKLAAGIVIRATHAPFCGRGPRNHFFATRRPGSPAPA